MKYASVRRAEAAGNVTAVLLYLAIDVTRLEVSRLLKRCYKVFGDVVANTGIRQGARPEFLSVVSREFLAGEIARHLQQQQ